jgi:hypothetical protein
LIGLKKGVEGKGWVIIAGNHILICKDIENKAESPRSGLGILSSRSCIVVRIRIIFCIKKVRIRQQRAKKSKEERRRAMQSGM